MAAAEDDSSNAHERSVAEALQAAGALYQSGDWDRAEKLCTSILELYPQQLEAIALLGVIAARTQRTLQALELLGRLVAAKPDDPLAHNNYGNVLKLVERFEEALQSYERALQLQPDYTDAHYNRGNVLQTLRRGEEALESYERALQLSPSFAEAHNNRGNVLKALGRFEEALQSYERALQLKAGYAEAHNNRGNVLKALGRYEEALQSYERAVQLKPSYAEAHSNRGTALKALGRYEEALQSYERALQLDAKLVEVHSNRGNALQALGRLEEALQSCDRALQLDPSFAGAHSNRAHALQGLGRLEEALQSSDRALQLDPSLAEAYNNRGNALQALGRLEEALQSYQRSLQLKPECAEAYNNLGVWHYMRNDPEAAVANCNRALSIRPDYASAYLNRGYAALLAGDFENGWIDHEWRWKAQPHLLYRRYPEHTLWLGRESLHGKTILLHSEQGLGDTLQFCRYIRLVADLGATVMLEVPAPLAALLADLKGVSRLLARGEPLPPFDYQCPLMSLPLAFRTSLSTIPAQVRYLVGEHVKTRFWEEKLGPWTRPRVGLVWSGGFRPNLPEVWPVNQRRNIPLHKLAPLRNAEIAFYSLQKGEPAESELRELKAADWHGPGLIDFTDSLHDFSDTAALIENLDLVISVDTATAHLAGALGKPVWIMNRFDTCWRWLLDRSDSPWYPTARLYRQPRPGDWDAVVERIRIDLSNYRPQDHEAPRFP